MLRMLNSVLRFNKSILMDKRSIVASAATVPQGVVVPDKKVTFTAEKKQTRLEKFNALVAQQKQQLEKMPTREIDITLPDGKVVKGQAFKTTPMEIAMKISKKLAERVIVARIQYTSKDAGFFSGITDCDDMETHEAEGTKELIDLNAPLEGDCTLELLGFETPEGQQTFWHSSAHLLGRSLEHVYNGYLTHGPPLKTGGFFYDIFTGEAKVNEGDYQKIEEKMQELVSQNAQFEKLLLTKQQALDLFSDNPFKILLIQTKIGEDQKTTAYKCGDMVDLCTGPHVPATGRIKAFQVSKSSGAYWLGKAENDSLQRVYGISFENKKQLDEHIKIQKELEKNDHKNIIEQQHLVHFNPLTPGCPFQLQHGTRIFNTLIDFMRNQYKYRGFTEVNTPNLFKNELWKISGHYFKYKEDMFFVKSDDDFYGMKPMNCPSHCLIFKSTLRSYRDLPIRLADFGVLHRNEASGALGGLTRVRKFHQDDAHIFCREDQIMDEIMGSLDFLNYVYDVFGFQYELQLSTRPEKYLGTLEQWDNAEAALTNALNQCGRPWTLNKGDGAFYGPKIDIKVLDCYKRKHQLGTIQLDFNLPQRFNLQFKTNEGEDEKAHEDKPAEEGHKAEEGAAPADKKEKKDKKKNADKQKKEEIPENKHEAEPQPDQAEHHKDIPEEERYAQIQKLKHGFARPVIVHRAVLGSLERCIALLCEHFAGKWPFWLSPRQIAIIPVSAKFEAYGNKLKNRLVAEGYFADLDNSSLTLNKRIRNAQIEQYNVILVVGEQEEQAKTVAIRYRDSEKVEHNVQIGALLKILKSFKPKPSKPELTLHENSLYGNDEHH